MAVIGAWVAVSATSGIACPMEARVVAASVGAAGKTSRRSCVTGARRVMRTGRVMRTARVPAAAAGCWSRMATPATAEMTAAGSVSAAARVPAAVRLREHRRGTE
jgi:hypothetical protein